jgi:hypothetical protein
MITNLSVKFARFDPVKTVRILRIIFFTAILLLASSPTEVLFSGFGDGGVGAGSITPG